MLPLLLACTEPPSKPMLAWSGDEIWDVEPGTVAAAWDGDSLWTVRAGALFQDGIEVRPISYELQDLAAWDGEILVLETDEQGRLWLNDQLVPGTSGTREARMANGPVIVRHVVGGNTELIFMEDGLVVDTGVRPGQDDLLVVGAQIDNRLLAFAWSDGQQVRTWPWDLPFQGRPNALEFWSTGHVALANETGLQGDCELELEGLLPPFTIEQRRTAIAVLAATEDYEMVDLEIDFDQVTGACFANPVDLVPLDAPIERVAYTHGGDEAIVLVELAY